jgi:hypothetical protein
MINDTSMITPELSDVDKVVLDIAGRTWIQAARKVEAIRIGLGWTPTRFAAHLNRLLDRADAAAWAPLTVNRLRRQRENGRGPTEK